MHIDELDPRASILQYFSKLFPNRFVPKFTTFEQRQAFFHWAG